MTSFITTMSVDPYSSVRVAHASSPLQTLRKMSSIILDTLHDISTFHRPSETPPPVPPHGESYVEVEYSQEEIYSNARTRGPFKPRNANKGTSSYQLRQFAEATLGSGSLRKAVKLPEGEDLNEWLAVNGGCLPTIRRRLRGGC